MILAKGITAVSTLACVAGVERGRGRGNLAGHAGYVDAFRSL